MTETRSDARPRATIRHALTRRTTMEHITNAQDVAAIWFMLVFGTCLLAQVFEPIRKAVRK